MSVLSFGGAMRRRDVITLLGSAAVAWPLVARAQQAAMPVIGFLSSRSPEDSTHLIPAFATGLAEGGYAEGQNLAIEFRWARGRYDLLPAMAAELVSRRVAVLAAVGGEPSALAASVGSQPQAAHACPNTECANSSAKACGSGAAQTSSHSSRNSPSSGSQRAGAGDSSAVDRS